MAPMIDMVFLLLVFFMTVGTLAQDARPDLDLAESATVSKPDAQLPRSILTVAGDPQAPDLYIGALRVDADQAEAWVRRSVEQDPAVEWELRVAEDTPYRLTRSWMERCTEAGVVHLHLSVFEQ